MEDYKKKYEDALERARRMCAMPIDKATMEYVFPELKDNDERIRKAIIAHMHIVKSVNGVDVSDILAWLEKVKNFDKQLEEAYKNSDEVQYKRGYDDGYLEGIANAKKELEKQGEMDIETDIEKPITIGKRRVVSGKLKELIDNKDPKSIEETKEKMLAETSKWTEEDEKNLQGVIDEIQANKSNAPEYDLKTYDRFLSWLKSIKQRLQ